MVLTLADITPISLCIVTQELFDTKRFQQNFGDNLILRAKDKDFESILLPVKREHNSLGTQKNFLEGYKVIVINNINKILGLVSSRYSYINYKSVESIVNTGKDLITKVKFADNFNEIAGLEPIL